MKHLFLFGRAFWLVIGLLCLHSLTFASLRSVKSKDAAAYPADVVTSWTTVLLKIARTTPAPPPVTLRRCAYTSIALYESIAPGFSGYQSIAPQLNGLGKLPAIKANADYFWPESANAALAAITRSLYPMTSAANKACIDSMEAVTVDSFKKGNKEEELARSGEFGKSIAAAIFEWSKTDGSESKKPYQLPIGNGLWVPTPPALMEAILPFWGQNRQMILGSDKNADLEKPIPYSTDPSSAYYAQVREVYDIAEHITPEQKAIALFWADDPDGKSFGGAHWFSILNDILIKQKSNLGIAAVANAYLGISCYEATISIFKGKYKYNGLRPVTFIRSVMKKPEWAPLIATPPHPEYPSGHALVSASAAQTLTFLFGDHFKFTDDSYNWLGLGPRSYTSFEEAAKEAGDSRVYGGIHYRPTCDAGQRQGKKIALNIDGKLKFKRGRK
ncbi:vanadium-dependent haloperoxidase [Dyadobacter luticola]|uniref:Vanadium-dependent haloperoxidase n=1 Tax=Dyadobacter luticola TaxID=1979387 RepID=A0A5R9L113_9BACT|nr:vanadium-dependent haloperoxidase [Dyadobacter luticola]TLV02232.1 vanadium-dependent haloperoxidase [Dyadobacter luticola]